MANQTPISLAEVLGTTFFSLLATSLGSVIGCVITMLTYVFFKTGSIDMTSIAIGVFVVIPLGLIFSTVYIMVVGFPAAIIGWCFNLIRWWSSSIVGFFLAFLWAALSYLHLFMIDPTNETFWSASLLFGISGTFGGFTFWLSWRFLLNFKLHR